MHPKTAELQDRTRRFASQVIKYCQHLPRSPAVQEIAGQLTGSAGSTDSNYRAACRARSLAEFIAKLGLAIEEADEAKGWLLLLVESELTTSESTRELIQEANELIAILVASRKTAERRKERERLDRRAETATRRRPYGK
ncbi:MAG TPA: four helix bundle protein [Vicinamibacterales bacterium]